MKCIHLLDVHYITGNHYLKFLVSYADRLCLRTMIDGRLFISSPSNVNPAGFDANSLFVCGVTRAVSVSCCCGN